MGLKNITKLINKAQLETDDDIKFLNELNYTIQKLDSEQTRIPTPNFKPSSIGGCRRMLYYQRSCKIPDGNDSDSTGIGIQESGTDRHVRLQKAVMEMKNCNWLDVGDYLSTRDYLGTKVIEKRETETKCYNAKLDMRFLCDGLITYNGTRYIFEIKTETNFKWQKRIEPEPNHIMQATCYSICLGVNKILFLYENRDICMKKIYIVNVTDEMKQQIYDVVDYVKKAVDEKQLPPKCTDKKKCKYCQYKKQCKAEEI